MKHIALLISALGLSACGAAQHKTITNVFCASTPAAQVLPDTMLHERTANYVWIDDVQHVWILSDGTGVEVELGSGAQLYFINTACLITKVKG
jgi:hypothetical protein